MSRDTALNALIRQPAAAIARLWQDHQENRHLRLSLDRLQQTSAHLLDDIGMSVVGGTVAINTDEIDIPGAKGVQATIQPAGQSAAAPIWAGSGHGDQLGALKVA